MRTPVIIAAIIVGLIAAFIAYSYMRQPRPLSDRLDSGFKELEHGNIGEAVDELGNKTQGDKLIDELKDATSPTTSPTIP